MALLEKKCTEIRFDCTALARQFAHRLQTIRETNSVLASNHGNMRVKRQVVAALGGLTIGGIAVYNWLTKHEASDYAEAIDGLKSNEDQLMRLVRNQTSVLELTDDVMKRSIHQMEEEHRTLHDDLKKLARAGEATEIGWQIHNIALQYALMLENLAQIQNHIVDAATTVHDGRLHPLLVSPARLQSQMNFIREHIGTDVELLATTARVYQLARVKVRVTNAKMIFRVSIPILRRSIFDTWRIIPISQALNKTFIEIRPTADYFLVNRDNSTYYDMTRAELDKCDDVGDELVCRLRHPLYKVNASSRRCEMNLVFNGSSTHTGCRTEAIQLDERWVQLSDTHSYVFSMNGTRYYNLSCDDSSRSISLTGNGLLHLHGNCSLEGERVQISTTKLETRMASGYVVSSKISMEFNRYRIIEDRGVEHINTTDLDMALQHLKMQSKTPLLDISVHDWHQYGLIYGLLIISAIIYTITHCMKTKISHAGFIVRTQVGGRENVRV